MARLGFADRDELAQWGRAQGAPADLPRLIRRLILETAPGLVSLGFAAGVGVSGSGWDGTARASAATVKVPGGLSLWELSTRGDVNRKANGDYVKRTSTPDGTATTDAAYVAVSTRTWQDRDEWARAKSTDGRWREVRAYGVDDLEAWLEDAPVTWAWISEMLGLQPHGLVTAQNWWEAWSRQTEPALPAAAILAGREAAADELRKALASSGQLVTIAGASRDDVLSFVSAVAVADGAADGGALLARAAYIDAVEAWRRWRDLKRPLVLAPLTEEAAAAMTLGTVHHVIVPVVGGQADLELPPIDAQAAATALAAVGLAEARAAEVGQLARLSLLAARRRIAVKPELHRPPWASPPVERSVRRVILLGRFNENAAADRAVIEEVVANPYEACAEELAALAVGDDPLLARLNASLGVVSHIDAWLLVAGHLRKEDVEVFHAAALKVLTESDPRQELAPDERWQAGVLGKARAHSSDLRHGLATTLALMGAYGDVAIPAARLTAREWAGWVVRQILEAANNDQSGRLWASLDDVMPLLAEAAPDEFVGAVRTGLAGDEPLLSKLFSDNEATNALFASPSHSGLLWALETCSWSPDHFGAVVALIARWAAVDPGGRYANRPQATLKDIFRPQLPQSNASATSRLDVIDLLRRRNPEVAWKLMLSLLPSMRGFALAMAAPRFRDWKTGPAAVSNAEVWSFTAEVFTRLLEDAGVDAERIGALVDSLPNLPPEARRSLYERLEEIVDDVDGNARNKVWAAMRAEAAKNREHSKAVWALPADEVTRLESIAERFQPTEATKRLQWLFDDHLVSLPDASVAHDGYQRYAEAVAAARADAAREITVTADWAQIYAFAHSVKAPWFFGHALASAGAKQYESELLRLLDSDDAVDFNLSSSYFSTRFRERGWEWLSALVATDGLGVRQRARMLLATDDFPAAWERLEDAEVSQAFWSEFRTIGLPQDSPHVAAAVAELFAVGRYAGGLDMLHLHLAADSGPEWADLVATGLEKLLVGGDSPELRQLSQYGLRELFGYLERVSVDESRLARLEWAYLPAFEFEPAPPTLSRYLATTPEFFVDVVTRVYRPDATDGEDDEAAEDDTDTEDGAADDDTQEMEVARNGYRLLSEWRTLPGLQDDATVDGDALRAWVEAARAGLTEARRLRPGDRLIGKLLAASPADPDSAWPCLAVRELLEAAQSEQIEDGMRTEIFNSLGITSRGVLDGGDQERDKSVIYREQAQRFVDRWPQTAAVLRDAAERFERLARDHDDDAERRRTGFDA